MDQTAGAQISRKAFVQSIVILFILMYLLFGPGGAGLHGQEEYVTVAEVIACRDVLATLALRLPQ